jgi:glycerol-3-phosphate dehydrogenase
VSTLPPADLDGLRRRTRVLNGTCQGFYCAAAVSALMAGQTGAAGPARAAEGTA